MCFFLFIICSESKILVTFTTGTEVTCYKIYQFPRLNETQLSTTYPVCPNKPALTYARKNMGSYMGDQIQDLLVTQLSHNALHQDFIH